MIAAEPALPADRAVTPVMSIPSGDYEQPEIFVDPLRQSGDDKTNIEAPDGRDRHEFQQIDISPPLAIATAERREVMSESSVITAEFPLAAKVEAALIAAADDPRDVHDEPKLTVDPMSHSGDDEVGTPALKGGDPHAIPPLVVASPHAIAKPIAASLLVEKDDGIWRYHDAPIADERADRTKPFQSPEEKAALLAEFNEQSARILAHVLAQPDASQPESPTALSQADVQDRASTSIGLELEPKPDEGPDPESNKAIQLGSPLDPVVDANAAGADQSTSKADFSNAPSDHGLTGPAKSNDVGRLDDVARKTQSIAGLQGTAEKASVDATPRLAALAKDRVDAELQEGGKPDIASTVDGSNRLDPNIPMGSVTIDHVVRFEREILIHIIRTERIRLDFKDGNFVIPDHPRIPAAWQRHSPAVRIELADGQRQIEGELRGYVEQIRSVRLMPDDGYSRLMKQCFGITCEVQEAMKFANQMAIQQALKASQGIGF